MAREQTEINEEKKQLEIATTKTKEKNKYGSLTKTGLSTQLELIKKRMPTSIDSDEELNLIFVTYNNSGRVYSVNSDGNITYFGNEAELKNSATITASPESNTTPQLVQYVDLKIETFLGLEDDEIFVHYAWTSSENATPTNSDYAAAACTVSTSKKRRNVTLTTENTSEGNYYLWVQAIFNENTITKKFGPYAVKDHTTLVATNRETRADSGFLGNTNIQRNKIRSVTITNSFGTHGADETSWDVSASKNGTYLAWSKATTDETDGTYYDIVIEGKGGVVANTNSSYLFANIGKGLTSQDVTITGLEYLDTGLTTNMYCMFHNCSKITSIDVSKFDTSKVTIMSNMFYNCNSLTKLDVSNFNTNNVIEMYCLFYECNELTNLDVSKFNTSNVTNMSNMFKGCKNLTNLDVSKFNTCNVTNMANLFGGCTNLTSLDVSKFNTRSVTNMGSMFDGCENLTNLDISKFNTSIVTNMSCMFRGCKKLNVLDISKFNTSNATNLSAMFSNCTNIIELDVTNFVTDNVTDMSLMFNNCGVHSLDLRNFNTSNVTAMSSMFNHAFNIEILDLRSFDTKNIKSMYGMFSTCSSLKSVNLSSFDTSSVTNMWYTFRDCVKLTSLDVSHFNTSNVTDMTCTFMGCNELTTLDLSNFDTTKVKTMRGMMHNCLKLQNLNVSGFDMSNVTDLANVFGWLPSIKTITTPKVNPTIEISLPGTFYDDNNQAYTKLNADTPTNTVLTRK